MVTARRPTTSLREVAFFRNLPDGELHALGTALLPRHFERNERIFFQGDPGDGLYIVSVGHVGITRESIDGNELLITIQGPGEYFGDLALLDGAPRAASAVAMDNCRLLFLSRDAFRTFLATHPEAVFTCLEVVAQQLRRLTDVADEIALLDVRSRLARRLLQLSKEGMVDQGDAKANRSTFRITQQHLANMLGATRESVNKHLQSLVDSGIIRMDRGRVRILDPERLQGISEGHI